MFYRERPDDGLSGLIPKLKFMHRGDGIKSLGHVSPVTCVAQVERVIWSSAFERVALS
jgi:hypothetical protein